MLFARVMGVVSPCIFLVSSIMWGLATGHLVAAVLAVALGAVAAFLSFRAWHRAGGGDVSLSGVERQDVVAAVREAWKAYWKSALFTAVLYCLNLVLALAMKGTYKVGAWDVLMLWFIVDGMVFSSWAALLRKSVNDLAGEGDAS